MICLLSEVPRMTRPFTRLLHLGNVVVDVVLEVPALPEPGGDVLATGSQTTAPPRGWGWPSRTGE